MNSTTELSQTVFENILRTWYVESTREFLGAPISPLRTSPSFFPFSLHITSKSINYSPPLFLAQHKVSTTMVMQTLDNSNLSSKAATIVPDEAAFLDEKNMNYFRPKDATINETPTKPPRAVMVSPVSPSLSSGSSTGSDSEEFSTDIKKIFKSEHKRAEEAGEHLPEPLLVENPCRFVLFPIQDNDVSCSIPNFIPD